MVVKKLLIRVNELKRSAKENDCEKCELCRKTLGENEVSEHLCEHEQWSAEINKTDTPDDISGVDDDSVEYVPEAPEFEQSISSDSFNEPKNFGSRCRKADAESNLQSLKNQFEHASSTSESEQPASSHLPNEPKMNLDSINATQNQHTTNKCNDKIFFKHIFSHC